MTRYDGPVGTSRISTRRSREDPEVWYFDGYVLVRKSALGDKALASFSREGCEPRPASFAKLSSDVARSHFQRTDREVLVDGRKAVIYEVNGFAENHKIERIIFAEYAIHDTLWSDEESNFEGQAGDLSRFMCWDAPKPEDATFAVAPCRGPSEKYLVGEKAKVPSYGLPIVETGGVVREAVLLKVGSADPQARRRRAVYLNSSF